MRNKYGVKGSYGILQSARRLVSDTRETITIKHVHTSSLSMKPAIDARALHDIKRIL